MNTAYRPLTDNEITALQSNGCRCSDWQSISVAEPFCSERYHNVAFSGCISLGSASGAVVHDGIALPCGISDATLHNVAVANNVRIHGVANYIANYDIAEGVIISGVGTIASHNGATFGIGTRVAVLCEAGGREVPIFPQLSAQLAYIIAMYRHNAQLTERLCSLIDELAKASSASRGTIASNATIIGVGTITDVNVGTHAAIEGATRLTNGTIVSSADAPAFVGANVIAADFIISAGARVDSGAQLSHTFVGQAAHLQHGFTAHDSLFFANCTCENGEAAAIFAGPYTVTMHKSTLLIGGLFSFFNAGSGTNQSNHMYKLGPVHQGVMSRGAKTASGSHILWPARIGAFTMVMGHHAEHPDTAALPFSYLIEDGGVSYLVPGANLRSVGTIRDAQKWAKRDRRGNNRLDLICYDMLNPYTVGAIIGAINLLNRLATTDPTAETYSYNGLTIKASALHRGIELYQQAVDAYLGNALLSREDSSCTECAVGCGEWVDLGGLLAPQSEVSRLCSDITDGTLGSLEAIAARLSQIANAYSEMEWQWVAAQLPAWLGTDTEHLSDADLATAAQRRDDAETALTNARLADAQKEFAPDARISFGIDAQASTPSDDAIALGTRDADFFNTRGTASTDPTIQSLLQQLSDKR